MKLPKPTQFSGLNSRLDSIHRMIGLNRNKRGMGIILIVMMLAFTILFAVGICAYEVNRVNASRDELRSACEAAALAGAAALASSDKTAPSDTHDLAEQAAQQAFVSNTILGTPLSQTAFSDYKGGSTAAQARAANPAANEATMYIEFLDQNGTVQPWDSSSGRSVHVIGAFGEQPSFGVFINFGKVTVHAESNAQVPQMDVVLCFDVSSSIDDQTMVSYVQRYWDGAKNVYSVCTNSQGTVANGTIYDCISPDPTGSAANAEAPQHLDDTAYEGTPIQFVASLRKGPAGNDYGEPPGNYPGGSGTTPTAHQYSDCVVNLDGNKVFTSFTYTDGSGQSWSFPNLAAVVEAARGNLESQQRFTDSKADTVLNGVVTPKAGYQAAYNTLAHQQTQPIGAARAAAVTFFSILNNNTDARFGLVGFSDSPPATTANNVDPNADYPVAWGYGTSYHPIYPGLALANGNFNTITQTVIPETIANGCTCMGDAAQEAVTELINNGRPATTKAVVFFTDGQPTCGSDWHAAANQAAANGIAIYTVGLAQNSAIIPGECENLNDGANKVITYVDPSTKQTNTYTTQQPGMAAVAGHGGKFFLVTNSANLRYVFENIARQLVQLSKTGS